MEPDTRSRILDAAEELLVQHGLDGTTLQIGEHRLNSSHSDRSRMPSSA